MIGCMLFESLHGSHIGGASSNMYYTEKQVTVPSKQDSWNPNLWDWCDDVDCQRFHSGTWKENVDWYDKTCNDDDFICYLRIRNIPCPVPPSGYVYDSTKAQGKGEGSCTAVECPVNMYVSNDRCEACERGHEILGKTSSSPTCAACGRGKYDDDRSSETLCKRCPEGHEVSETVKNGEQGMGCTKCSGKMYDHDAAKKIVSCTDRVVELSRCTLSTCRPNEVEDDSGCLIFFTACVQSEVVCDCPAGYKKVSGDCVMDMDAPSSSTSCVECPPGHEANATSCSPCLPGTYTADSSKNCKICPPGSVTDTLKNNSATTCTKCPAGKISQSSTEACTTCGHGTYAFNGTECLPCESNMYDNDGNAATPCVLCEAGSWTGPVASGLGSTKCTKCEKGFWDDDQDSSTPCVACEPGSVTETTGTGATACTPCPTGSVSHQSTQHCANCPIGQEPNQREPGSSTCVNCRSGFYNNGSSSFCLPCRNCTYPAETLVGCGYGNPGTCEVSTESNSRLLSDVDIAGMAVGSGIVVAVIIIISGMRMKKMSAANRAKAALLSAEQIFGIPCDNSTCPDERCRQKMTSSPSKTAQLKTVSELNSITVTGHMQGHPGKHKKGGSHISTNPVFTGCTIENFHALESSTDDTISSSKSVTSSIAKEPLMVFGDNNYAALGLTKLLGADDESYKSLIGSKAIRKIVDEFEVYAKTHSSDESAYFEEVENTSIKYLDIVNGVIDGTYRNPGCRWPLPSLQELMRDSKVIKSGLEDHHVLAIRIYTTACYIPINRPFRTDENKPHPELPHPFAGTMFYITDALKMLRIKSGANHVDHCTFKEYWRGIRNRFLPRDFVNGTEMSCMSTSNKKEKALEFVDDGGFILRIACNDYYARGQSIKYISVYPTEDEILYPPLTYLNLETGPDAARANHRAQLQINALCRKMGKTPVTVYSVQPTYPDT